MVSYETVRRWVNHFGPMVAADLRKRRPKPHTTWRLDEVYLKISKEGLPLLDSGAEKPFPGFHPRFEIPNETQAPSGTVPRSMPKSKGGTPFATLANVQATTRIA